MLKQWEIKDSIFISREVSNKSGFGVLHATQLIGHAARLRYCTYALILLSVKALKSNIRVTQLLAA